MIVREIEREEMKIIIIMFIADALERMF